jgi:hypothetical protein
MIRTRRGEDEIWNGMMIPRQVDPVPGGPRGIVASMTRTKGEGEIVIGERIVMTPPLIGQLLRSQGRKSLQLESRFPDTTCQMLVVLVVPTPVQIHPMSRTWNWNTQMNLRAGPEDGGGDITMEGAKVRSFPKCKHSMVTQRVTGTPLSISSHD